jgi:hypothetical protein
MKLLEKLKSVEFELNACKVDVPELGDEPQFVAEISGDEYDDFVEMWQGFRDKLEEESNLDFKRAVVAFCWCDENRDRLVKDKKEFSLVIKQLRIMPNAITELLYEASNALNAFLGVDVNVKKLLLAAAKNQKNDDGSGELL